jgi:hypothetical protein
MGLAQVLQSWWREQQEPLERRWLTKPALPAVHPCSDFRPTAAAGMGPRPNPYFPLG